MAEERKDMVSFTHSTLTLTFLGTTRKTPSAEEQAHQLYPRRE